MKEEMPQSHEDTKIHEIKFRPLSEEEERIGKIIVNSAFEVHKRIGPGLLEKVYEICFCNKIAQRSARYKRQVDVPIVYDNLVFNEGLRLDVIVEELVICELKAVEIINPVWEAQILSHLRLTGKRLGYLINFNVPLIKNGIRRFVI